MSDNPADRVADEGARFVPPGGDIVPTSDVHEPLPRCRERRHDPIRHDYDPFPRRPGSS